MCKITHLNSFPSSVADGGDPVPVGGRVSSPTRVLMKSRVAARHTSTFSGCHQPWIL